MTPEDRRERGDAPTLLEVGIVARPHGLRGEVVVALSSNRPERMQLGSTLTWRRPQSDDPCGTLEIAAVRPFNGRYLVVFEGVATLEAAESLRGAVLLAPPIDDPSALFVHDLIGSVVVEVDGTSRGRVVAVQANPASDLLVLEDGGLVPLGFVKEQVEGTLVVDAPPGLFD